jgi:aryl-alcohol dehydrogenase-like predicted oxidoreductase
MEQPQYNLFVRHKVEREFARLYESLGLGTTIWSPLASGILSGKYAAGIPAGSRMTLPEYQWLRERLESLTGREQVEKAGQLARLAAELGCSPSQLAIAWCARNPQVSTVILGASTPAQLAENLAALDLQPRLTPEILVRIEAIVGNAPAPAERF